MKTQVAPQTNLSSPTLATKICNHCKLEFPLTTEYFYKKAASKDGLYNHCRICELKYTNVHQANPAYRGKPKSAAWKLLETKPIKAIYKAAQLSGLHVDHIHPLQADELPYPWMLDLLSKAYDYPDFKPTHRRFKVRYGLTCGLHLQSNLQLLDGPTNSKKSNQFQSYRETPNAVYILSPDGLSWLKIEPEQLKDYLYIKPQLFQLP